VRADASRNEARVLEAARGLVVQGGAEAITIDRVAGAAGVGKATVIRRFGDKAGLIAALLGDQERRLQDQVIRGRPPLGPGGPPLVRIDAFLDALARLYVRNLDLVYASETASPGARYRIGAHQAWRQHLGLLVREARPDLDADLVAHVLLAPLAAESLAALPRPRALVPLLQACARGMLDASQSSRQISASPLSGS
jgi:AcrR family transcriptional regulator